MTRRGGPGKVRGGRPPRGHGGRGEHREGKGSELAPLRGDRMSLDLAGAQMDLAHAVLASGHPTVVVLIHGSPLAIPELARKAPAILDGFYLGEETGTAVANVLFGDANPAGRLPWTVPRTSGAVPAYYNHKPSAERPYLFEEPGPLWAFGHGQSYTTFRSDPIKVHPARITPDGQTTCLLYTSPSPR